MKKSGQWDRLALLGGVCFALSSVASSCDDGDAKDNLDSFAPSTNGNQYMCFGQVIAAETVGGEHRESRIEFPAFAWAPKEPAPVDGGNPFQFRGIDDPEVVRFVSEHRDELCGLPGRHDLTADEWMAFMDQLGSAPCICYTGQSDLQQACANSCEELLNYNPAYLAAPGDYQCVNDDQTLAPPQGGAVSYGYSLATTCCDGPGCGASSNALTAEQAFSATRGGSGGPTQFVAVGRYHLDASDGAVQSDGIGTLQYNADISDGCAQGCDLVISRMTMRFADSGWEEYGFGDVHAVNLGPIQGRVSADGEVTIPAGGGYLMVAMSITKAGATWTGDIVSPIRNTVTGRFDAVTGALSLSTVAVSGQSLSLGLTLGELTVMGAPPVVEFGPTGTIECTEQGGAQVLLRADGTYDPDGDLERLHWVRNGVITEFGDETDVFFPLGQNEVALNAFDSRGALNYKTGSLDVVDTTPPVWGQAALVDLTSCDEFVDRHRLTPPVVTDLCSEVAAISARIVASDGLALLTPVPIDYQDAVLPGGEHVIEWTAADSHGNESTTSQVVRLGPAVLATRELLVRDEAKVRNQAGAPAGVGSLGTTSTQLGVRARVREILSKPAVFLQNYAIVDGRVVSEGAVIQQHGAAPGSVEQFTAVPLGRIPWLADYATTSFGTGFLSVERGQTQLFTGGSHGHVNVKSGGSIHISGLVAFNKLELEPDATIVTAPGATIVVNDRFAFRGAWSGSGSPKLVVLKGEVWLDRPLRGVDLVAPEAQVTVATNATGSVVRQLVGGRLEINPGVVLVCDRTSTL